MPSVEIKDKIYWVGALDWNVRDFHGYNLERGTTYNAYLLLDNKNVLFDTVKKGFRDDLLANIKQVINPQKIDYLVINHVEMDHSGCVPEIIDEIKPEKVFLSTLGEKIFREHYHSLDIPITVVKTGDEIKLGKRSIRFYESRMLHWPDSMVSYIPEEKLLFSNDIFGQHWATSERFDDQVSYDELMYQVKRYYANIILPYGKLVLKFIELLQKENVTPDMLACDHGVIWRKHLDKILEAYTFWANYRTIPKVVIVYDTMWGSTELMAKAIGRGVLEENVPARVMRIGANTRADIITEIIDAKAVILGSSTLNNHYLPSIGDVLTYIKGLRPANKIGAAFGSYGWGGEAVKMLNGIMEEMNWEIFSEGIRTKFVPGEVDLEMCTKLGRDIAKSVKQFLYRQ
jgi:flavorubredoxin